MQASFCAINADFFPSSTPSFGTHPEHLVDDEAACQHDVCDVSDVPPAIQKRVSASFSHADGNRLISRRSTMTTSASLAHMLDQTQTLISKRTASCFVVLANTAASS